MFSTITVPRLALTLILVALASATFATRAPAARAATLTGVAFADTNRDGSRQLSEQPLAGHELYLFSGDAYVAGATTDAYGRYSFSDLADGDYRVLYAAPSWWALRQDWVPTTTPALRPARDVHVTGSATADFGWRTIVRSTDPDAPISTYTGPSGLRVSSYDDVVGARELYDALALGMLGAEAPQVEVRFDLEQGGSMTTPSVAESNGVYSNYKARCYVSYLSWLDGGDQTLSHEYGHAWSLYYAYIARQDPELTSYIAARGLAGDPRIGTSYAWSPREMIAEDYRQLFGSANARAASQINTEIPPPAQVPGLLEFLRDDFTRAPAPLPPPPPPALQIGSLAMSPDPVKTTGTVTFTLSAPAAVTVRILAGDGTIVRTLLTAAGKPAGSVSAAWDRKDAKARRVARGTYRVQVDAVGASGTSTTAAASFGVA